MDYLSSNYIINCVCSSCGHNFITRHITFSNLCSKCGRNTIEKIKQRTEDTIEFTNKYMREHEIINQRIKRIEGENTTMINSVIDAAVSEMLKENSETTANKLSEYILKNKPLEVLTAIYTLAMTCSGLLPESLQSIEMREKVTMKVITEVFADSKCGDGVKWRTNEEKLEGKYVSWLEESIRVRGGDPSNDNIQTRDIGDPEGCHIDFDAILCELLKELGFDKVVRTYNKTGKLYA